MRGFSPKLIITKQLHPFYRSAIDEVRCNAHFHESIRSHADANRIPLGYENAPYFAKYIGDLGNVLIESAALYFHLLKTHENIGAGATLAKWAASGCVVHHLVCTDGSKGTWDPEADTAQLVELRQREQRAAAAALEYIQPGTVIGVGTGSTVNFFIDALAGMPSRIAGAVSSS